jgi:serine/threonine protein kinase
MTRSPPSEHESSSDDRPWQAEKLLRAVVSAGSDGAPTDAGGPDSPINRIERFLDGAESLPGPGEHQTIITITEGERTLGFRFGAFDTPPVEVPNHELLVCIGAGGFGQVWLARQTLTDHFRACKIIPASHAVELEGLKKLKQRVTPHPNLFPIDEVGRAGEWLYVLMPLADPVEPGVAGDDPPAYRPMTLRVELASDRERGSRVNASIARDILAGMAHLHDSGVTHGDIKPGNILRLGGRWTLADYGLARDSGSEAGQGHTPGFIPPEGPGGEGADIFAAGVVISMLATNTAQSPADGTVGLAGMMPELRRPWRRIVRSLCNGNPRLRRSGVDPAIRRLRRMGQRGNGWKFAAAALLFIAPVAGWAMMQLSETKWSEVKKERILVRELAALSIHSNIRMPVDDAVVTSRLKAGRFVAMTRFETESFDSSPHLDPAFLHRPGFATDGSVSAAITQDGRIVIWGACYDPNVRNPDDIDSKNQAELDRMTQAYYDMPDDIRDPVRIAMSGGVIAVVESSGRLVVWGLDDRRLISGVPSDLGPVIDVCLNYQGTIIVSMADGTLRGWGANVNCDPRKPGPLDFPPELRDVDMLSSLNMHWAYRTFDGQVGGHGCNFSNQTSFTGFATPAREVSASESWSAVLDAVGRIHVCGFRTPGCWLEPPFESGFLTMATGHYHGIALHNSGMLVTWGDNRRQKGAAQAGLTNVVGVLAGYDFSGVFDRDGRMTLWGENRLGGIDWPEHERIRLGDPDLDSNGIADWIDILRVEALDGNRGGVQDHSEETSS